jgi:hypothetical protein
MDVDALIRSISAHFDEPLFTSERVEADLGAYDASAGVWRSGVPVAHFQAVKTLLMSNASWSYSDAEWRVRVAYELDRPPPGAAAPTVISYVDAPERATCASCPVKDAVYWREATKGLCVRVSSRHDGAPVALHASSRYSSLRICRFREFHRVSSAAAGIVWIFRLSVQWSGASVRAAYEAEPQHRVQVVMRRHHATPGYTPVTTDAMRLSLAANMCGKTVDMLRAGTVEDVRAPSDVRVI